MASCDYDYCDNIFAITGGTDSKASQSAWTSQREGCMTCWDHGVALLMGLKQFISNHPKT